MKSVLLSSLIVSLWITGCSADDRIEADGDETATTTARVLAKEDDAPPPPVAPPVKSKPCPHHTPNEGDACSTKDRCFYAVEQAEYPRVTLVECRCAGTWACLPKEDRDRNPEL